MSSGEYEGWKSSMDAYKKIIIERLAEIEHEQWWQWAEQLIETEQISEERRKRWEQYFVSYYDLPEEVKEYDREWARKVYQVLRPNSG